MKKLRLIISLILCIVILGCSQDIDITEPLVDQQIENQEDVIGINDNDLVYQYDKDGELSHVYVTILPNQENDLTFFELNNWYLARDFREASPELEVYFQEGDENGPKGILNNLGDINSNAILKIRGNSSKGKVQKSYKIKLFKDHGLWKGQDTLNLNKHMSDITRVKNKISFDYFEIIPNITSLRTHFVKLYVKDLTNKNTNQFKSYGLYTHVEQVNKDFLASHGMNPYGSLYKAINFEFKLYPAIRKEEEEGYDKTDFEKRLEIKGSNDHEKLITMLEDVNNLELDINEVFNKYFDRENFLTWVATSLLFGNIDTMSNNYYLYSPVNSTKWYFLPWDYDGGWGYEKLKNKPDWQIGLSRYWGNTLHKRYFKDPKNIMALKTKMEELLTIITPDQTRSFLDSYYPVISTNIKESPDKDLYIYDLNKFEENFYSLVQLPQEYYQKFNKLLESPMPIYTQVVQTKKGTLMFTWDHSFDVQGDDITYTLEISSDIQFENIIFRNKGIPTTSYEHEGLESGKYYFRVTSIDELGNSQISFDIYKYRDGVIWGISELIVE